jgi:hypothetical protein
MDKELLLKDLCSRIMYGVKCTVYEDTSVHTLSGVLPNKVYNELYFEELDWKECDGFADIQYCKPYLFPLSSMTEEQKKEQEAHFICIKHDMSFSICRYMEWCYKNHLDVNGLLPKGLALDATGLNIY